MLHICTTIIGLSWTVKLLFGFLCFAIFAEAYLTYLFVIIYQCINKVYINFCVLQWIKVINLVYLFCFNSSVCDCVFPSTYCPNFLAIPIVYSLFGCPLSNQPLLWEWTYISIFYFIFYSKLAVNCNVIPNIKQIGTASIWWSLSLVLCSQDTEGYLLTKRTRYSTCYSAMLKKPSQKKLP